MGMERSGRGTKSSSTCSTVSEIEAESNLLREEIKEQKKEALRRLEKLSEHLSSTSTPTKVSTLDITTTTSTAKTSISLTASTTASSTVNDMERKDNDSPLLPPPSPVVSTSTRKEELVDASSSATTTTNEKPSKIKKSPKGNIVNLLEGTRWKVSLSIGREPGTWMPSTWGKSGSRINVSFIMDFTSSQLYDRDDFLRGSYAGCKVLHVVDNVASLGPTVTEGAKSYSVKDGGWRIIQGEGPMGTDLLRFYVEFDERIAHSGGDVDIPKGRVYCSCGYFPFVDGGGGSGAAREAFTKELNLIEERIAELRTKRAEITNPFNFDGIKLSREIFRLNQQEEMINGKLMVASVREPDRRLLRFSKDGDVGLTKEGGVCIQVNKGPAIEYHILGRFGIASVDN